MPLAVGYRVESGSPRSAAAPSMASNKGCSRPSPRRSGATVTPATPHVRMRSPCHHDSYSWAATRATSVSPSKAPHTSRPGGSSAGASGGVAGYGGAPNASAPSRNEGTWSSSVSNRMSTRANLR